MEFLTWIQNLSFITWIRESESLFGYTLHLAGHTIGMVFLVGPNLLIAARVLDVAPGLPLRPMAAFRPVMTIGLWITIVTGSALFATAPVGYVHNVVFIVKIAAIMAALACVRAALRVLFERNVNPDAQPVPAKVKRLIATSVLLWTIAVVAGRLTAYSGVVVVASIGAFLVLVAALTVLGYVVRFLSSRGGGERVAFRVDIHPTAVKEGK